MAWQPQADVPGGFSDEAMLVAALRGGQHEAFEALHESFAAPIYNLALRIVDDREEAKDVAQEVLIKAYRGLPSEEPDLSLTPWLYRVTVNAAFDHVRARERRPKAVCADEQPHLATPVDGFEQSELARRVEDTLRALPKRQQVALLLRDVHGLSVGETAGALGLTRGSADVLLSRARSGFRRVFTADADAAAGRCTVAADAVAGAVGAGIDVKRRDALIAHARSCPECRKAVGVGAAAPLGLGAILQQLAAPAELTTASTAAAVAAAVTVAGGGTAGAVSGGLLAKLGALAGAKVATVAAVATVAVGTAGVATFEVRQQAARSGVPAVATQTLPGLAGAATWAGVGADDASRSGRERLRAGAAAHDAHRKDPLGESHRQMHEGNAPKGGTGGRSRQAAAANAGGGADPRVSQVRSAPSGEAGAGETIVGGTSGSRSSGFGGAVGSGSPAGGSGSGSSGGGSGSGGGAGG